MKLIALLAATLALALSACSTTPAAQDMVTVTRVATYSERIALPPDAVMTVRIEDANDRLMWITDTHTPVTPVAGEARIDLGTLVMVRTPG